SSRAHASIRGRSDEVGFAHRRRRGDQSVRAGAHEMITGLLGKKVGMTQLLGDDGTIVPVTVIQAGPCVVVQRKTKQKDGYDAVQLGLVEFVKPKRVTKPMTGHFKKSNVVADRFMIGVWVHGEAGENH